MNHPVEVTNIELTAQNPQYYPSKSTPYQPNHMNQPQMQPNPFNQPQMQPNPFNQPNTNYGAFAACNQGLSNGFGAMFFNIRDPNFTQKN